MGSKLRRPPTRFRVRAQGQADWTRTVLAIAVLVLTLRGRRARAILPDNLSVDVLTFVRPNPAHHIPSGTRSSGRAQAEHRARCEAKPGLTMCHPRSSRRETYTISARVHDQTCRSTYRRGCTVVGFDTAISPAGSLAMCWRRLLSLWVRKTTVRLP